MNPVTRDGEREAAAASGSSELLRESRRYDARMNHRGPVGSLCRTTASMTASE
jgi:hypothetical protein